MEGWSLDRRGKPCGWRVDFRGGIEYPEVGQAALVPKEKLKRPEVGFDGQ